MRNGIIVEFPTGRRLPCPASDRKTVAALAKRLAIGLRIQPRLSLECQPLSVELRDLSGVSDRTIDTLASLAEARALTPASAARLAMRHAREIGHPAQGSAATLQASPSGHLLVLAGDVFGRFAFRIEDPTDGAWVAYATLADLSLLSDVCPPGGGALCLVPDYTSEKQPTIVLRRPRDWRTDLAQLPGCADQATERRVIVVGGLASSGWCRTVAIAGIADGLRRGGMRVRAARCSAGARIATAGERERQARRYLVLIEIAFPGLVEVLGDAR